MEQQSQRRALGGSGSAASALVRKRTKKESEYVES